MKPAAMLTWMLGLAITAHAAAPQLLHTPGYESPVRGDPGDLLMIAGTGFHASDRVIYQAMDAARASKRTVPAQNTSETGIASIVQRDRPPYALTVLLPPEMRKGRAYWLWAVTAENEWSEPVAINDPRPQWITPSYVHSTAQIPGLGRVIRIVGRNLAGSSEVKLRGSKESYTLSAQAKTNESDAVQNYVVTAALPARLAPGLYTVGVRREDFGWIEITDQRLEVRPDPPRLAEFSPEDSAYGGCHPDDAADDSPCFERAIDAAGRAGGGVVRIPPGHWNVSTTMLGGNGFLIPHNVHLRGAGPDKSFVSRHGPATKWPNALLTLTGHNSVVGLSFSDEVRFDSKDKESRQVIQLGAPWNAEESHGGWHGVEDIVISGDVFLHVGQAITDQFGRALRQFIVTSNIFGAYSEAIHLAGNPAVVWESFRIDDSVVRGNRFVPGSYVDVPGQQGMLASELGAGHRVDFSANVADGTSTESLQDPDDPPGFRAAFFWNLNNSVELTLVSDNQISCPGDKVGDGEAVSLDGSGNTYGFAGTPVITAAGPDWITVRGKLNSEQAHRAISDSYYNGHWIQIVAGPGFGQTRKITSYVQDAADSTVTLHVAPAWDIVPGGPDSRIGLQRQMWQMVIVGNSVEQRRPPCRKANLTARTGGQIGVYTPSADLAIEGNRQWDTDGIQFATNYSVTTPSCPQCGNLMFFQAGLEIRGNRVEGEYDWSSDCSNGGIRGVFGGSPTPESSPPVLGFAISISHNIIIHADAYGGGGIDTPPTWIRGPPPGNWPFMENLLIFDNQLQDIEGPPPSGKCHRGQRERIGIRIEGENTRYSVLRNNRCERVSRPFVDQGVGTQKLCSSAALESCECSAQ